MVGSAFNGSCQFKLPPDHLVAVSLESVYLLEPGADAAVSSSPPLSADGHRVSPAAPRSAPE